MSLINQTQRIESAIHTTSDVVVVSLFCWWVKMGAKRKPDGWIGSIIYKIVNRCAVSPSLILPSILACPVQSIQCRGSAPTKPPSKHWQKIDLAWLMTILTDTRFLKKNAFHPTTMAVLIHTTSLRIWRHAPKVCMYFVVKIYIISKVKSHLLQYFGDVWFSLS